MRRITNILLTTLAAGSLVACSDERLVPADPDGKAGLGGSSYMNLSVYVGDLPFGGTRAGETEEETTTTEGLNDEYTKEGRVGFLHLAIKDPDADQVVDKGFFTDEKTPEESLLIYENPYYKSKHAWEIRPKKYHFGMFANHPWKWDRYPDTEDQTPDIDVKSHPDYFDAVILNPELGKFVLMSDVNQLVDNGYLMQPHIALGDYCYTHDFTMLAKTTQAKTIIPGVTKEQAESPIFNPQLNNNVDFELERVIAKAAVTGPMSAPLTLRGEQVGTFYFDYYTVTRQPDRFYALSGVRQNPPHTIFLNNGTYSTDANAEENIPIGLRSRIDEAYNIGIYEYGVIGRDGYRDAYPSVYKVLRVSDANTPLNKLYGIYLPENFLTSGDEMRWFNTSHFKVYGVFDPNADLFVDAELYKSNADKRPAGWDHTFYYNKTLNRFCYELANLTSVNTSTEAEREQMKPEYWYKYTNGRGFYRTPVHVYPADADFNLYSKPVTNADVVRNNFYIVDIAGISDMPSNWDNVDSGNPGLTADGRRKHGNSDYPSHLFRDKDHRYYTEADLGHTQGADLITPPDYVGLTRDVPNLKYNYEWGNQLYIAKPTDGKTDKPYDNIDENTPINSKRVTLRVRARVMRWNVRMVDSPMGLGDASTY